jgi:Cu+-exporting ATPase
MTTDTTPSASALLEKLRAQMSARQAGSRPAWSTLSPARDRLLVRLVVALVLTGAILVLTRYYRSWAPEVWVQLALAALVTGWCAWPLHRATVAAARDQGVSRDVPVSLGLTVAFAWSAGELIGDVRGSHFWTVGAMTALVLAGRLQEFRTDEATRQGLRPLLSTRVDDVAVLRIDPRTRITGEIRIATDQLVVGDQFVVRTGEIVVADGGVVDGSATLDRSRVLGDVPPVDVAVGDSVAGGALSTRGRLVIEARSVGADTLLSRIQRLARTVDAGTTLSTRIDRFVDRASALLVPLTLVLGVSAVGWWFVTGSSRALTVAVSVLVGTSPAALALAVPSVLRAATGRSAQLGILVKGTEPLEQSRLVDTVVVDQTGTVTCGELELRSIAVLGRLPKAAALKAAAAVEQGADDPVARAILAGARLARIELPRITDFAASPGEGATARIKGAEVTVGRAALFDDVDDTLLAHARAHGGHTVFVGWDGTARAALTVEDVVRPSSRGGIERLRKLGLTAYLTSSARDRTARAVAAQVDIEPDHVRSDAAGDRAHIFVAELQRQGRRVAMVGTGRTASGLEQADLGIALADGTDVATESADIIVLRPDLEAVADAIGLSRVARTVTRQNIAGAVGYNAVVLALGLTGVLVPVIAAAGAALASLVVLANALRLRDYRG